MTTEEIYNEIVAEKESGAYSDLDELNSTSNTSVWRLWVLIFAFFSKTIRELFTSFVEYVESVFAKNQAGTLYWWIEQIKKFQYGDTLEFLDGVFKYSIIDEEKQIVKQVALESLDRLLTFKAASMDETNNLIPLTTPQVDALTAYIDKIKFPGTFTKIVSQEADTLRLTYRIYYNGQAIKSDLETSVREAANKYLAEMVFNGRFSLTSLTDEFQKIKNVINPVPLSGEAKNHFEDESAYAPIEDYYTAVAGYMKIDELNLEFIPDV
jgi:hypothetical protein